MEVDLDKIKAAGLNSITPVLISNTDTYDKSVFKRRAMFYSMKQFFKIYKRFYTGLCVILT